MLTIDEEDYPIVSVQFETAATLADTEQYLSRFDHWLSCERSFGIIVQQSSKAGKSDPVEPDTEQIEAVHRFTMQWTKQNKAKIAQFCVGIALVVDAELLENRRKTAPKTIAAIYGCPGQVFGTKMESKQWIQQHL